MTAIPILNPALRRDACCGYGERFALDLLMELWRVHIERGAPQKLTRTCPSCGTAVTVDWAKETVFYDSGETPAGKEE
jgi:hypothetical protein